MQAVIDRIEGSFAIVLIEQYDMEYDVPLSLLPSNIQEGNILQITCEVDYASEINQRNAVANKMNKRRIL